MDHRRPCQQCGRRLRDDQAVTVWCEKDGPFEHLDPRAESFPREQWVAILCGPCAETAWPTVRDAVRRIGAVEEEVNV